MKKIIKISLIFIVLFTLCGCQYKPIMYFVSEDSINTNYEDYLIPNEYAEKLMMSYENIEINYSKYKYSEIYQPFTTSRYHIVSEDGDKEYYLSCLGTAGEYICDPYDEYFDLWREYIYCYTGGKSSYFDRAFQDPYSSFAKIDQYNWINKEAITYRGTTFLEDFEEVEWRTYFVNKNSDFNKMSEHFYGTSDMEDEGKTILDIYLELTDNSPKLNQEVIYKGFRFKSIGFDSETHYFLVKLC